MNMNIGHSNEKVIEAICEQAKKLVFVYPGIAHEPKALLAKKLTEISPKNISKVFFCLGGAEAVENAMKMAWLVTGRKKIVTRYRSYHGATMGANSLSGDPRRLPTEPGIPGVVRVMDPYCYRCPFGWTKDTCHRECIKHVEEVIRYEGPENVAAIIMEGVTGSSGLIIPPDEYWPSIRQICDKYDILLISDEVMSGFGRTGKWFGIDHWDVKPDMIAMAKGLTCGYIPLGAVTVSPKIASHFDNNTLWCGLTYSGHPIACAAGVATLQVYEDDKLIENAANMGKIMAEHLQDMKDKHPCVGDVRSIGLFGVIELVKNRQSKQPMAPWNAKASELGCMADVAKKIQELGMFTFVRWNWIFTVPPLCINRDEMQLGFDIIDQALSIADKHVE
jgi:taurine--2-oxoglutarate transaminase